MVTEACRPYFVIATNSSIEITKEVEVLILWHLLNQFIQLIVEPIFDFCVGGEGGGISRHKVNWAIYGVEAKS